MPRPTPPPTKKSSDKAISDWMKRQLQQGFAIDPKTDEVNMTALGEAACIAYDLHGPGPDYEIPERLFEIAFEVAEWWEALPTPD